MKFQYDVYHLQIMEGNLIETMTRNAADIGHVQIGDVPGRHEPGSGEINYPNVLAALDRAGFDGYVGLEYVPAGETEPGLDRWLPRAERANQRMAERAASEDAWDDSQRQTEGSESDSGRL